ncbi:PA2928 family protein [Luteolibacter soli]|uniref:PA2928 family protein n=1 Tax=Luteolibacter soli TaxID=3135280 RepID=A0ABU9B103_9BACT
MKNILLLILLFGAAALLWKFGKWGSQIFLTPPEMLGGPVRVIDEKGDRLYYLTSQWEKRISYVGGSRSGSNRKTIGWLNVDLWALDAATAQPVFRKRLKRDRVNGDYVAMGQEQGILWARIPELVGIRLSDGATIADSAKIEARNPSLKGLIPKPPGTGMFLTESMQPLKFDASVGMIVRLDDARQVRIDPLTLEATPYVAPKKENDGKTPGRTKVERLSNGMEWRAMVRGVNIQRPDADQDWLGLIADSELEEATTRKTIGNQVNFSEPMRHKLYRARLKKIDEFLGPRWQFLEPIPLPESPEFLMGGLLTQESPTWDQQTAMWRKDPPSVFVLSRDRLGETGRMQIARITGPAGRPAWSKALPLSAVSAWLPGERHALMLGPDPSVEHSPMTEEGENQAMQIISIDLETGEWKSFNPDLHRDWPAEDLTQQKP